MNGRRLLVASVISIQNSHFVYPSCQNCFSKLFLNLKRYSCLKCGCSGDSKEANYRYRLSLEVADTQSVFEVTVFGTCLDVYFGVTANDLQRYIEKEIREPDRDAVPDMLFHAVESCFIGKKFIFGIKDFGKTESAISWQNDSRANQYCNALTACQMFMPNSTLIGNTVIHYLHQRQSLHFKQGLGGAWLTDPFVALDQPSSLLSSLYGSNDLDVAPSCSADGLSALWPQSFQLTSSPASSGTAADPGDLNPSQTVCTRQKWEDNPVSLHGQLVYNSEDHHLIVTKRNEQEDKRHHLHSSQRNSVNTKSQSESDFFIGREGGRSLQSPLEFKRKISPGENCTQHNYWLKKSCDLLPHQRQGDALGFPAPSSFDADSQEDPGLWDELPSSESLDEFIARLERDNTVVSPTHFSSDRADEFHGHLDQLSPQLNIYHVYSKTEPPGEKSQILAEMVENHKSGLPCHQVNLLPSHNSQESHQQAFRGSLSCKGREESVHLLHQPLVLLPSYFSTEVTSHTEESRLKYELEQDIRSSKCYHSRSSSKLSRKYLKSSSLQIRGIAYLNDNQDGNLFKWKEKQSPCNENHTLDITNIQEDSFTLVTCEKTIGSDRTKEKLLCQDDRGSFKVDVGTMLQNCSNVHEVSYNASADLFDSAQEPEARVGKLNSTHVFLAQEKPVTKQCITSEFTSEHSLPGSLYELNGSLNASLCSMPDPKTDSPVAGLLYGPEHSLVGSLDFIPNSQSTPLARPCLQGRVLKGKEPILGELPLNKLSWVRAKWKTPRPTLGNPSLKRLVNRFLQCTKSSDATEGQQLFTQSSPVHDLPENDGEEWIPPSDKKQIQSFGIQNEKVLGKNLVRNNADYRVTENSPLSERCGIPMSSITLFRGELSSKRRVESRFMKQPMGKDKADRRKVMNGSPGFSDVRSNLSSTPHSSAKVSSWSPELFSNSGQFLSTDIFPPKLSS